MWLIRNNKFDMIVLDYIDCVESTRRYNDEWSGEGNVMRGFESMLAEYNIVGWTAVQGNRSSISSTRYCKRCIYQRRTGSN